MSRLDNRAYYDDFAGWYERERHLPYHRMLDDLEVEIVERYAKDRDVLEVGCGTGLILGRVAEFARTATGIDLSGGMLAKAAARGLAVAQASATDLPIATASVDVAYSFKVLAHIPDIAGTMREMARVVRPGGRVVVLEITTPQKPPLSLFFELWFDRIVPALGRLAGDAQAYSYLPNSVRRFPGPRELAETMSRCGLEGIRYVLTAGGIIALHGGVVR